MGPFRTSFLWGLVLVAFAFGCDSEQPNEPPSKALQVQSAPEAKKVPRSLNQQEACAKICRTGLELNCPAPEERCLERCRFQVDSYGGCNVEGTAALSCMASTGAQGWECDDDGFPALRRGSCDKQQEAMVACLIHGG